ncbi:hypothetical protein AWE51_10070 [Aquimarina aggregata]|uniref:Uncharacterized protein n=1 Tax=Aquimarina aggregata TaxID=1642818 RepID=A0A162ZRD9_9FLAO|nr:hypothetical protein [Aquimarina aggregata]KZS39977.1 hypothetical protein AWE51_10070 [Aquimarina aggregata]
MASKDNLNKLSREELLKKLQSEYEESETLQWFIEVEIKRLTAKGEMGYEELKKLTKLSEERISKSSKKKK